MRSNRSSFVYSFPSAKGYDIRVFVCAYLKEEIKGRDGKGGFLVVAPIAEINPAFPEAFYNLDSKFPKHNIRRVFNSLALSTQKKLEKKKKKHTFCALFVNV